MNLFEDRKKDTIIAATIRLMQLNRAETELIKNSKDLLIESITEFAKYNIIILKRKNKTDMLKSLLAFIENKTGFNETLNLLYNAVIFY